MAIISCPECNKEISDTSKTCIYCGYKFNKLPKKVLFASVIGILAIVVLVVFITNHNSPTNRFIRLLHSGEYQEAMDIYQAEITGGEDEELIIAEINNLINELYIQFLNQEIEYTDAIQTISIFANYGVQIEDGLNKNLENLNKSRVAFDAAKEYGENQQFTLAINELKNVIDMDDNYSEAQNMINIYTTNHVDLILNQVDGLVLEDKFEAAINLLIENKVYDFDENFKAKANEIESKQLIIFKDKLEEIKPNVAISYDSISKIYFISLKGQKPLGNDLDYNTNIDARIAISLNEKILDKDFVVFTVMTGFIQKDWLFLDSILFACDEDRHEWKIKSWERNTDIGGGQIFEGYTAACQKPFSYKYSDDLEDILAMKIAVDSLYKDGAFRDCSDLMNAIINSETTTIRFSGSNGTKDHVITTKERQVLTTLWELYEILEYDPKLIELLK